MKAIVYTHIQKTMLDTQQHEENVVAYLVARSGPYYEVTKTPLISDNFWIIHESNVLAIFNADHKIWKYLYL